MKEQFNKAIGKHILLEALKKLGDVEKKINDSVRQYGASYKVWQEVVVKSDFPKIPTKARYRMILYRHERGCAEAVSDDLFFYMGFYEGWYWVYLYREMTYYDDEFNEGTTKLKGIKITAKTVPDFVNAVSSGIADYLQEKGYYTSIIRKAKWKHEERLKSQEAAEYDSEQAAWVRGQL